MIPKRMAYNGVSGYSDELVTRVITCILTGHCQIGTSIVSFDRLCRGQLHHDVVETADGSDFRNCKRFDGEEADDNGDDKGMEVVG